MIDYAQHLIKLEKQLKACHDLCLEKKYESASLEVMDAIVEARLLYITLGQMEADRLKAEKLKAESK